MILHLVSFLVLFFFFDSCYCKPVIHNNPKSYTIHQNNPSLSLSHSQSQSQSPQIIQMVNGQSVFKTLKKICQKITKEECITIMDEISSDYYDSKYTPSRSTSTIEDYYAERTDIILYLANRFEYKSYLEIGCQYDVNFNKVKNNFEIFVGVDPFSGGTLRMTSDEFFQQNDQLFDLIYLDGDHTSEQVWKDIVNSLNFLAPSGTVVLHDLNPRLLEREADLSNGDGWKAAVATRLLPDYEIIVVDVDHGCGIIRKRPNTHRLPDGWHNALVNIGSLPGRTLPGAHSLSYEDLDEQREVILRLMSLVEMRQWIEEEFRAVKQEVTTN
jgi:hypothetical protein